MPHPVLRKSKSIADYATLLGKVKETLVLGQRRIEEEKVRTYWETGDLIVTHTLHHKDRAQYGSQVIDRLADDLDTDSSLLRRCVKFRAQYPRLSIQARGPEFSWSHYRKLITIPNAQERLLLEKKISRHEWSAAELGQHLKSHRPERIEHAAVLASKESHKLLTALRGNMYTYQIVQRQTLGPGEGADDLLVDLGFGVFRDLEKRSLANFKADDIVASLARKDAYGFSKTSGTVRDLYTYRAFVERVIDGDTLKVRLDLGFNTWIRQTLRLRDIDAPEIDTKEGVAAKAFVQSFIKDAQMITVRSSRSDKYDRYLADVFIPVGTNIDPLSDLYLNNLLLQNGHAQRMPH